MRLPATGLVQSGCRLRGRPLFRKELVKPYGPQHGIPVPDPRLPGPGAGYPAAGPGAGCRLPGRPFLRFFFWKNSKNCSTDSRDQNKIPKKNLKNSFFWQKFLVPYFVVFFDFSRFVKYKVNQKNTPLSSLILIFQGEAASIDLRGI